MNNKIYFPSDGLRDGHCLKGEKVMERKAKPRIKTHMIALRLHEKLRELIIKASDEQCMFLSSYVTKTLCMRLIEDGYVTEKEVIEENLL